MEQLFKLNINGSDYVIMAEAWQRSGAWGHKAYLLQNGHEISRASIRYYNRTWESYRYQTAAKSAVSKALEEEARRLLEAFKARTGRQRLTKRSKEIILHESPEYRALLGLSEAL